MSHGTCTHPNFNPRVYFVFSTCRLHCSHFNQYDLHDIYVPEDAYRRELGYFYYLYIFVALWDQLEKESVVRPCVNPPIFGPFSPSGRSASREHCNRCQVAIIDKIVIFCPHPIWHSVSNGHIKRTALRHFHSVPPQMSSKWWTSSSRSLHSLKAHKQSGNKKKS